MKDNTRHIDNIIIAYLTNNITDDELQVLNQWKESSAQNRDELEQFISVWKKSKSLHLFNEINVSSDWNIIQQKISKSKSNDIKLRFPSKIFRQIAAITIPAIILFTSGLLYWNVPGFGRLISYHSANKIEYIELPDNSVIVLNKNTQIIYPKNIKDASERKIKLSGEAYFEVAHNNTPFIINVGEAKVEVLGTKFNVNQANTDLYVSVFSGKVSVEAISQKVELTTGEQAKLSKGKLTEEEFISTKNLYWQANELKFNQSNLKEICEKLKNTFSEIKKIQINAQDSNIKVTTTFKNQSLREILDELQIHFDKKFIINGSTLIISD